jgi:enoyl-CoA hydratase/carnithine racemase
MLLHVDFVVASATARFRTQFVPLGTTAEAGSSVLLARTVGERTAARMLYLGEWLTAGEAHRAGLVSELSDRRCPLRRRSRIGCWPAVPRPSRPPAGCCAPRAEAVAAAGAPKRAELGDLLAAPRIAETLRVPPGS